MNTQIDKLLSPRLLARGMGATLLSGVTIAALAILVHGAGGGFTPVAAAEAAAPPAIAAPAGSAYRCAECGVIESMREIKVPNARTDVDAPGRMGAGSSGRAVVAPLCNYEITIRLQNGKMRVIRDAKPAKWRHGEPVIVIAGAD